MTQQTWMKHDRRVWSTKTSPGHTLIIPLKGHRPTAWHGTWVHSHWAPTYLIPSPTATDQAATLGVPMHHRPKTDSAQESPGLQDLGLPVPHSPGPNRPHFRPHLSSSSLLGSHPSSCKILKATSLGPKPELMRTSWESRFHDEEWEYETDCRLKAFRTTASNSQIHHKADFFALKLVDWGWQWWAGRWGQAVLLQNQGGPTHTTRLGVPVVLQLCWAQEAGRQDCMTSVPHCVWHSVSYRGEDQISERDLKWMHYCISEMESGVNMKEKGTGDEEWRNCPP